MTASRVSVCIPTYNSGRYIAEAIGSVLEQTFTDLEVVVSDNCSTDDTREVVQTIAARDARVRWTENDRNLGMTGNFNACLRRAAGTFIKFILSDDRFARPDALRRMVDLMERDRSIALVATARAIIDERSQVVRTMAKYGERDVVFPGSVAIKDGLVDLRNLIGEPSTVLFRKEQAERGFDARYRQFVDLEMWFHLLLQGDLAYLHEPLCAFRVHDQQQTAGNLRDNVQIDEQVMLLREYGAVASLKISALERSYMRFLPARNVWRLHTRHGRLTREEALQRIRTVSPAGLAGFFAFFPFYRIVKLYVSMKRRVVLFMRRRPAA
jgi:glycosyltransferase involved in cell wall biosynthesis